MYSIYISSCSRSHGPHLFHRLRWPDLGATSYANQPERARKIILVFLGGGANQPKNHKQLASMYGKLMLIYIYNIYTNIISMSISILSESKLEFLKRTLFVLSKKIIPNSPLEQFYRLLVKLIETIISIIVHSAIPLSTHPTGPWNERKCLLCVWGSLSSQGIPMTRYQWIFRKLQ